MLGHIRHKMHKKEGIDSWSSLMCLVRLLWLFHPRCLFTGARRASGGGFDGPHVKSAKGAMLQLELFLPHKAQDAQKGGGGE
jgi:hypothetical protein